MISTINKAKAKTVELKEKVVDNAKSIDAKSTAKKVGSAMLKAAKDFGPYLLIYTGMIVGMSLANKSPSSGSD